MEHRQARAFVVTQLFDDVREGVVEVDPVDVTARNQNIVDRDVVQRVDTRERVRAADGVFAIVVPIVRRFVFALLHHFGFAHERSHQQLADAMK
ncbi:hypothetical protein D3C86_1260440 [compost metagenome]